MTFATVPGLGHQPDTRPHLAPVAELPPEQLEREARRAHLANPLQARQVIASLARGSRQARLPRLLECRELLLGQCQPFALAQQPLPHLGRQWRAVMRAHVVTGEAAGEGLAIDLTPPAERCQQPSPPARV